MTRRYPRQDVRRKQFEFEDTFGPLLSPNAVVTNLPADAPPAQPRFILSREHRIMIASNIGTQLTLQLGYPALVEAPSLDELRGWARNLDNGFDRIFAGQRSWYSGAILVFEVPHGHPDFQIGRLFEHLFKPDLKKQVASFSATTGFRDGMLNLNFEVSQYAVYNRAAEASPALLGNAQPSGRRF